MPRPIDGRARRTRSFPAENSGINGDIPAPADYNGEGSRSAPPGAAGGFTGTAEMRKSEAPVLTRHSPPWKKHLASGISPMSVGELSPAGWK
ncbi:MAG: hypothetical protein M3179_03935 [Actinomycetota bacterium]|nr:hypothetical protein [Actinomycetota bacterium]